MIRNGTTMMAGKHYLRVVTDMTADNPSDTTVRDAVRSDPPVPPNALTVSVDYSGVAYRTLRELTKVRAELDAERVARQAEQDELRAARAKDWKSESAIRELKRKTTEYERQFPDRSPNWRWLRDLNRLIDELFPGDERPISKAGLNKWFSDDPSKARVKCRRTGRQWRFDLASMKLNWEMAGYPMIPWSRLRLAHVFESPPE